MQSRFDLAHLAPAIFVLLWATGFIGAKFGLHYAEPFTFLSLRLLITLAILAPIAALARKPWPNPRAFLHSAVAGMLVHAAYLGGVFYAIEHGMAAGVAALVVALQPLVTAFVAWAMIGEHVRPVQAIGLVAGLAGVGLVLLPKVIGGNAIAGITAGNILAVAIAVAGISIGAVYQKKHAGGIDIRHSAFAQYAGALPPLAVAAYLTETGTIAWTWQFAAALVWLVLVLSIGAIGLLIYLIRANSAARVASLFYLVPAVTAIIAYLLFGETLQVVQLVGMAITLVAVAVAARN